VLRWLLDSLPWPRDDQKSIAGEKDQEPAGFFGATVEPVAGSRGTPEFAVFETRDASAVQAKGRVTKMMSVGNPRSREAAARNQPLLNDVGILRSFPINGPRWMVRHHIMARLGDTFTWSGKSSAPLARRFQPAHCHSRDAINILGSRNIRRSAGFRISIARHGSRNSCCASGCSARATCLGPWMPQDHLVSLAAGIRTGASNDPLRLKLLSLEDEYFLFARRKPPPVERNCSLKWTSIHPFAGSLREKRNA